MTSTGSRVRLRHRLGHSCRTRPSTSRSPGPGWTSAPPRCRRALCSPRPARSTIRRPARSSSTSPMPPARSPASRSASPSTRTSRRTPATTVSARTGRDRRRRLQLRAQGRPGHLRGHDRHRRRRTASTRTQMHAPSRTYPSRPAPSPRPTSSTTPPTSLTRHRTRPTRTLSTSSFPSNLRAHVRSSAGGVHDSRRDRHRARPRRHRSSRSRRATPSSRARTSRRGSPPTCLSVDPRRGRRPNAAGNGARRAGGQPVTAIGKASDGLVTVTTSAATWIVTAVSPPRSGRLRRSGMHDDRWPTPSRRSVQRRLADPRPAVRQLDAVRETPDTTTPRARPRRSPPRPITLPAGSTVKYRREHLHPRSEGTR